MKPGTASKALKGPVHIGFLLTYPAILLAVLYVSLFLYGNTWDLRQRLQDVLAGAVPGTFDLGEIRLRPSLTGLTVYGARLLHPDGRELIAIEETRARLDVVSTLFGGVTISEIALYRPRVLVSFDDKGRFELEQALTDTRRTDPRLEESSGGPELTFENILIEDADVLIHQPGFSVLVEHARIGSALFSLRDGVVTITGDVHVPTGRVTLLPELFNLVDPRETVTLRRYRTQRRLDPWGAAKADLEPRYGEDYGALVIPVANLTADDFSMQGDQFQIESVVLDLAGENVSGEYWWMNLDVPKSDELHFAAQGYWSLPPSSPVLAYFAEDAVQGGEVSSQGELYFDVAGSLAQIGGALSLDMQRLKLAGHPLDRVSVSLVTDEGGPFYADDEGIRLAAAGGQVQGNGYFDPSDGTYSLDLWVNALPVQWLLGSAGATEGIESSPLAGVLSTAPVRREGHDEVGLRITGDLDAKGFPSMLSGRFEDTRRQDEAAPVIAVFRGLRWDRAPSGTLPFEIITATGAMRLGNDGRLQIGGWEGSPNLRLRLDRDGLQARGSIDLLTQRIDDLRLTGDTSSLRRVLNVRGLSGRAAASVVVRGAFDDPQIDVERLEIRELSMEGFAAAAIDASFRIPSIAPSLRVEGGSILMTDVVAAGFTASHVTGQYALDGDWLGITDTTIDSDIGRIEADGRVRLFHEGAFLSNPSLDLELSSDALDLGGLLPNQPVAGTVEVAARVQGSAERPQIAGQVGLREAILFGEWVDRASAQVEYGSDGVRVSDLVLLSDGARLTGEARLDEDFNLLSGRLLVSNLQLENLNTVRDLGVGLEGVARLNLRFTAPGDVRRIVGLDALFPQAGLPDIEGEVVIRPFAVAGSDQGAMVLAVDTYGDTVQAVGQLSNELSARISLPMNGDRPIRAVTSFDRIPLETLAPSLSQIIDGGEAVGGRLTVELAGGGEALDVSAQLLLNRMWLETGGRHFTTNQQVQVDYRSPSPDEDAPAHRLCLGSRTLGDETDAPALMCDRDHPLEFGTEDRFLRIQAELRDFETLDVSIGGEAELSLLTLFTEAIAEASGIARLSVGVEGTLDQPQLTGDITFEDALFAPRGLGDEIVLEEGVVRLSPESEEVLAIEVPRESPLTGRIFDGSFLTHGAVRLVGFAPESMELDFDATNLSYRIPDEASLTINRAELTLFAIGLSSADPVFYLSGHVYVEEALYFKDYGTLLAGAVTSTLLGLFEREVELYEDPIWRQVPLLENLHFDLGIHATDGVLVQNSVLDAEVDAELQLNLELQGTLREPQLNGDVRVLEGQIRYQNRTFDVQSCVVQFSVEDGIYIDSCVAEATITRARLRQQRADLSGESEERITESLEQRPEPYIIQVTVTGRPDDIEYELRSVNYALHQADIVSLIFTGQTADELSGSSAGQPSIAILVRQLTELLESEVQDTLSLDEFSVEPTAGGGTMVELSEQVTDRLSLDVESTVFGTEDSTQVVTGQLTLVDWLILELSARSTGQASSEATGRLRLHVDLD